ncbi:DNA polymerase II subunit B4-like [Typha angustifolia]|uniref:DNA polymerase II subunit B4-like n=1 Tax=Typha angustifolia TaxID=59011 RepID=UPI003C2C03D9
MAKEGNGAEGVAPVAAAPQKPVPEVAVEELPRAIVRRVVKDKLSRLTSSGGGEEVTVHKDALLAFAESARIFIHYISATANDICKESSRQTINAEDVLKALEEIEFPEFIEPLRASLEEFRRKNALKRSGAKAKGADKKRKLEEELPENRLKDDTKDAEDAEEENEEESEEPNDD